MTKRRQRRSGDVRHLTDDQRSELLEGMVVILARSEPGREGEVDVRRDTVTFPDHETARRAWQIHREELTTSYRKPGKRPRGWWLYEAEEPWPLGAGPELRRLHELDVLEPDEIEEVKDLTPPLAIASTVGELWPDVVEGWHAYDRRRWEEDATEPWRG